MKELLYKAIREWDGDDASWEKIVDLIDDLCYDEYHKGLEHAKMI